MSLFVCNKCRCIENTATSTYWSRLSNKEPLLCSDCDPEIKGWHRRFKKQKFNNKEWERIPNSNYVRRKVKQDG